MMNIKRSSLIYGTVIFFLLGCVLGLIFDTVRPVLSIEDVSDVLMYNQHLGIEVYPNPDTPYSGRHGQMFDALLYYYGPSDKDPQRDTLISLHWFNVIDYIGSDDVTLEIYTID